MTDLVPYDPRAGQPVGSSRSSDNAPSGDAFPEGERDAPGLREHLAVLRRHWALALTIFVAAVGITAYMVVTAPPQYRAVSIVRLVDARRALTGDAGSDVSDVIGRETDVLLSQIQVLQSRPLAGQAVDRAGLRFIPADPKGFLPEIASVQVSDSAGSDSVFLAFDDAGVKVRTHTTNASGAYGTILSVDGLRFVTTRKPALASTVYVVVPRDRVIRDLLQGFRATPRPKTDIIDLAYVGRDPHVAQSVANAMALTFQSYSGVAAQDQSRRRRIFLEEQLRQTDGLLKDAMAQYSGFRSGQQVYSSKEMASAQQSGIVDVEMRRAELDAQRRTYLSLLTQAQRSRGQDGGLRSLVSAPGIAANPVIQQLYGQLSAYETQRDSLTISGAAPGNPDVVGLNGLIATTSTRIISAVRSQIAQLDASISALDNLKARSSAEIARLPGTETQEAQLSQQVATFQKIADQLQGELQKAKMSEAVETGQVQIVDLADTPSSPEAAGRFRRLALGILLGAMLAYGAAALVDGMNTSIRRRDDVERVLQVPGLAIIPKFTAPGRHRLLPGRTQPKNGKSSSPGWGRVDELVTVTNMQSSSAEAYRTLRTNLIFSQSVRTLRTLVITSASPGEGKTTTAANLAVSFAQQGLRVLIVDCDLRRARLHRVFKTPREPGVTELVLGLETQESTVVETETVGLYVLPSGRLPPNPAEMLGGERMRSTLTKLTESFDMIILDTPPLLAASDASILATMVDGVLLVVRAGETEAEAGVQAIQQLNAVGARIVGAVLNDPDAKVARYGSYYHYEYASES